MKSLVQAHESFDIDSFEDEIAQLTEKTNAELYEQVMADPEATPLMLVLVERLQAHVEEMTRMEANAKSMQQGAAQDA